MSALQKSQATQILNNPELEKAADLYVALKAQEKAIAEALKACKTQIESEIVKQGFGGEMQIGQRVFKLTDKCKESLSISKLQEALKPSVFNAHIKPHINESYFTQLSVRNFK